MSPRNFLRWPSAAVTTKCLQDRVRSSYGAKRSRLQPIKDFVTLVERHWDGVIAWHATRVSNGLLEGTNSLIQAAKTRARGYRTKNKMITIAYLIAGKLPLPTVTNARPA